MISFKKMFGRFLLKLLGWKMKGEIPSEPKYVAVVAPHTSIRDMLIGKVYGWATGMNPTIMVKKEFFFFPLNKILKWWGSLPVDRQKPKSIVDQITDAFIQRERMILVITPEGTRAANPNWKTGFYRIALNANVPIYLMFGDFKEKTVGYIGKFEPTGNTDDDIKKIKKQYLGITPCYPDKFDIGKL